MGLIMTTLKWILIIIAVLVLLGILLGGPSDQPTKSTDQQQQQATEPAKEKITTSHGAYQDSAWLESVYKYSPLLGTDFGNLGPAIDNRDYTTLATVGQNIVDDTQKALDENSQYTVSPKYQEAQKEWISALNDYNYAGKYIILAANDGKAGNNNPENALKASELMDSGASHLRRSAALLKVADETA